MTTVKIRPAKPLDTSNITRLLIEAHGEGSVYPTVDQTIGVRWVTQTLAEGYTIVADVSGRLVGTLALTNYQFPWSPEWFMYLEWLYVQKKFRKGGAFNALMTAAHAYADEHSAPLLAGVSSGDVNVFLKDKAFQQNGYHYIGGTFIRRAQDGRQQQEEDQADVHTAVMG